VTSIDSPSTAMLRSGFLFLEQLSGNTMKPMQEFLLERLQENGLKRWDSASPRLGTVGTYKLGGQADATTGHVGRELSQDELDSIDGATTILRRYLTNQQLFEICRRNFSDFEREIEALSSSYSQDYNLEWSYVSGMVVAVNMRILNLLSSIRTYLDHTEARLKRTFGADSRQVNSFKESTAHEYDNCFSYRFVYRLRNFTQHCGMPLGRILTKSDLNLGHESSATHYIDFFFERDHLLAQFDSWGNPVKGELSALPEYFAIGPHLKSTMDCLHCIDTVVQEMNETELEAALANVDKFLNEAAETEGVACIVKDLWIDVDAATGRPIANMNLQRFHTHVIEEARAVIRRRRQEFLDKPAHQKYAEGWERVFGKK